MTAGLIPSVILGGVISIAVVIVGGDLKVNLASAFRLFNSAARYRYGMAICDWPFAAGFTSTITAALAGSFAIQSGLSEKETSTTRDWYLMKWWGLILVVGLIFGISGIKPIPVIILAQAANGFILPLIAFVLWLVLNNASIIGAQENGLLQNIFMAITVGVTSLLGLINVFKATYSILGQSFVFKGAEVAGVLIPSLLIVFYGFWKIKALRISN